MNDYNGKRVPNLGSLVENFKLLEVCSSSHFSHIALIFFKSDIIYIYFPFIIIIITFFQIMALSRPPLTRQMMSVIQVNNFWLRYSIKIRTN